MIKEDSSMYCKKIGVLMLDTKFERPLGDIGNPKTFPFPVKYKRVAGATVEKAVIHGEHELIKPFIQAAKELEHEGIMAITTSCGFLAIFQKEIQHQLNVPFFSSSLLQLSMVSALTGGTVGIITASKSSLTDKHFEGASAHNTPKVIEGMDDMPFFTGAIVTNTRKLDMNKIANEMKQVTTRLIQKNPEIKAIILECTNMPPYKTNIQQVTALPIFDINTLTHYVYTSL